MLNQSIISHFGHLKTPFYFYNMELLNTTLTNLKSAAEENSYHIHYAVKANANNKILSTISEYGFGADCVSGNEIELALKCGFSSKSIVFAGVGKTDDEIRFAIENDIFSINCESLQELAVIDHFAGLLNKKVDVALRINPNIDANTHHNITTGLTINKFGISEKDLEFIIYNYKEYRNLNINGLHFHIGSQINDLNVYKNLCEKVNSIQEYLFDRKIHIKHINLGGGFGVNYENPFNQIPDFRAYFSVFSQNLKLYPGQTVHFEPGRSVVAQSGILVTKVLYAKENQGRQIIICDAGFTELLRPALYQSKHKIINLESENRTFIYDVAGPICESTDYFGRNIELPETNRGDLLAILSAGAYGEVMASQYNLRTLAKKYYSDEMILDKLPEQLLC